MDDDGEDHNTDNESLCDEMLVSPVRRPESPVSPPRDDIDDDGAQENDFVFTGAMKEDFIPSSQYGEQRFDQGADVVLSEGHHIYVCFRMRDDDNFLAAAAGGFPQQGGADAVGTSACPNKGVLYSSNIAATDVNLSVKQHGVIPSSVAVPAIVEEPVAVNKGDGAVGDEPADAHQPVNEPVAAVCAGSTKAGLTEGQQEVSGVPHIRADAQPDVVVGQAPNGGQGADISDAANKTGNQMHTSGIADGHAEQDHAPEPSGGTCSSRQFIGKDTRTLLFLKCFVAFYFVFTEVWSGRGGVGVGRGGVVGVRNQSM